jgi:hypothetical protein
MKGRPSSGESWKAYAAAQQLLPLRLDPAAAATGLAGVHLHDLRHTGNQFIADAGANPRELMARMAHDSARAALIYLHSSAERQRALANEAGKKPGPRSASRKTSPSVLARGRHATGRRRHEALSAASNMHAELVFHWPARQDSNPRPAA